MKLVTVHAGLLLAAAVAAYLTWARSDAQPGVPGSILLWSVDPADVTSVAYDIPGKRVVLEQREDDGGRYLWATVVADSAGAAPDTTQFLVGDQTEALLREMAEPRALRELGAVDAAREEEYGLQGAESSLEVSFDSETRRLLVGGTVFGTGDRYVKDEADGEVYVLPGLTLTSLGDAQNALLERRLHAFDPALVATVNVVTPRGERAMRRVAPSPDASPTWTPPDAPDQPDQTFANFMERVQQLFIVDFVPPAGGATEPVVRLDYFDASGALMGYGELFRSEGATGPEFHMVTEHTRFPARIHPSAAETGFPDVTQLF